MPKCVEGIDDEGNLVLLTPREHYIAHLLLIKIYKDTKYYSKLLWAYNGMCNWQNKNQKRDYKYNSHLYEELKGNYKHSEETKDRIAQSAKSYYNNLSDEEKLAMREKMKEGRKNSTKIRKDTSGKNNPMYGKEVSKETREKISKAAIGREVNEETRKKISIANKGSNNSMALTIEIYNDKEELIYTSNGNFKQLCEDNNLPYAPLYRSYKNNSKLFQSKASQAQAKNSGMIIYKDWYATKNNLS